MSTVDVNTGSSAFSAFSVSSAIQTINNLISTFRPEINGMKPVLGFPGGLLVGASWFLYTFRTAGAEASNPANP